MCGFLVYFGTQKDLNDCKLALDLISHRGPDDLGCYFDEAGSFSSFFGHVRLSLTGLGSSGLQPMVDDNSGIVMVFNGEIYNFRLLADRYGIPINFETSDSYVAFELYKKFGFDVFKEFNGMFSFVIWDKNRGKVFAIRDQLGIKPLYYVQSERQISFSSEIKAFSSLFPNYLRVSSSDIFEFLNLGFVCDPRTGFENVKKVPMGNCLELDLESFNLVFHDLTYRSSKTSRDFVPLLKNALKSQSFSHAKIGNLFSGGTDSSFIAANVSVPNLFVDYSKGGVRDNASGDAFYAKNISDFLNLDLIVERFDTDFDVDDVFKFAREVAVGVEELISDATFSSTRLVCSVARSSGFKAMLSGMGADELLFSYPRHFLISHKFRFYVLFLLLKLDRFGFLMRVSKKLRLLSARFNSFFIEKDPIIKYVRLIGYLSTDDLKSIWKGSLFSLAHIEFTESLRRRLGFESVVSLTDAAIGIDRIGFLQHNLTVTDKASMLESVEVRVPFLDFDCFNLASRHYTGKSALTRDLFKLLPKNLVKRRKQGFNPPLSPLIESLTFDRLVAYFDTSPIYSFLDRDGLLSIISQHFSGVRDCTYIIWQLIFLTEWLFVYACDEDGQLVIH